MTIYSQSHIFLSGVALALVLTTHAHSQDAGAVDAEKSMVNPAQAKADSHVAKCRQVIEADVVALDQAYQLNRLGTSRPGGLLFALRDDVESTQPSKPTLEAGFIRLKSFKRPRPIVLRVNVGDCLNIKFQNLLAPAPIDPIQPVTRNVSIHVAGMQVRDTIESDGTWVGANPAPGGSMSGLVAPGASRTYQLYAAAEGANLLYSTAADYNQFGTMQLTMGLFGAVNIEPQSSEWYRSQVTEEDLRLATTGMTADGHPILNYDALYPPGNARAGRPVLRMLDANNRIAHSDLTAIITGPEGGLLPGGPGDNPVLPDRNQPFREVTVHYHESQDVVQAFPFFYNPATANTPTVNAGQDSFAINYGVAGIAPEILANRIGVGAARECVECKFEEFFLSSWALGDPGLVVDVPANASTVPCTLEQVHTLGASATCPPPNQGKNATKAFYPDDPSNVYHTYLGDHVRFRILHAGAAVHHVHHHHAHQWLNEAKNQNSNYLDSQSIGPGSSYTLDMVYEGSGNRNLSSGDSIFHCHFYPHFASGMWALFRTHDVFESGTPLDSAKRPMAGSRALPDGEIDAGTPIPGVVPIPTMAMAPMPSKVEIVKGQVKLKEDGFPGYPFYVPGVAGHRAPHPPLDFAIDQKSKETYDGGLPRHLVIAGTVSNEQHSTTDWSKDLSAMTAYQLPEGGTPSELSAMKFFGSHLHPSFTPRGKAADFRVNGLPNGPQQGAPYADPAVVKGKSVGNPTVVYKGVNLQLDNVFNKAGWHYPQQRMMALWGDVADLLSGKKPPEPLFFRATSNDVVEYWHTNLVPSYFELDDFQVRTPTDILGQHIHLVKFDVQASDGAANGFNYEDGTFGPEEVRARIAAINQNGGLWNYQRTAQTKLKAKAIAELGVGPNNSWVGAQATVQRWWVDPLMDTRGVDRTYMTVFTHDHFGPSTHQMIGLYGGLLVEPPGTKWTSLDGKTEFGTRDDGGPTSYAANILYRDPKRASENYREFALAWGDLQLAYLPSSRTQPDCYSYVFEGKTYAQTDNCRAVPAAQYSGWSDHANAINPPNPPQGSSAIPSPLLIADFGAGMMSMNYRTEPLPMRVNKVGPPSKVRPNPNADPDALDLASAFRSIQRSDPAFSRQPTLGTPIDPSCTTPACFSFPETPISGGMQATDPFTPLLQGYEGDKVQLRLLVGSHTSMHNLNVQGIRWKAAPFASNSGYVNSQFMVLSEHFEPIFELPRIGAQSAADYLYNPSSSFEGLTNGIWGLLRSWNRSQPQAGLAPLQAEQNSDSPITPNRPPAGLSSDCARVQPCLREFKVHAMTVQQATGSSVGTLVYNGRGINLADGTFDSANPLNDPNALVYVLDGKIVPQNSVEPLILRAAAGDWIHVTLINEFTGKESVFKTFEPANRAGQVPYANPYSAISLTSSANVGLHPQLVELDITGSNGANVGVNPVQTAGPKQQVEYWWYAGKFEGGKPVPIEFGSINLMPADPLMQVYRGLFGALIVEPAGSHWVEDPGTRTAATVFAPEQTYREFVLMLQDDISMQLNNSAFYAAGFPMSAFNYRTEPFFYRFGKHLAAPLGLAAPSNWKNLAQGDISTVANLLMSSVDTTLSTANRLVNGDPVTPILRAPAGMPVRIRLLNPGGVGDNQQVFELTGHVWQEAPYTADSTQIGFNPVSNWTGTTPGYGPTGAHEIVLEDAPNGAGGAAGGRMRVPGDYLYRSWTANQFQAGAWGIFRVAPSKSASGLADTVGVSSVQAKGSGGYLVKGFSTIWPGVDGPRQGAFAPVVLLNIGGKKQEVSVRDGFWEYVGRGPLPTGLTVTSPWGGRESWGDANQSVSKEAPITAAKQLPAKRANIRLNSKPRVSQ